MAIPKTLGIETEFGIWHRGTDESNHIAASSLLINAYLYELSGSGRHNAQIMAKVSRGGAGEWTMTAIGAVATGRTFADLLPATAAHL